MILATLIINGAVFELEDNSYYGIGNGTNCSIRIQKTTLDQLHAILVVKGKFFLTDLNSKYGTFINEQLLEGTAEIYKNCKLQFGNVQGSLELNTSFLPQKLIQNNSQTTINKIDLRNNSLKIKFNNFIPTPVDVFNPNNSFLVAETQLSQPNAMVLSGNVQLFQNIINECISQDILKKSEVECIVPETQDNIEIKASEKLLVDVDLDVINSCLRINTHNFNKMNRSVLNESNDIHSQNLILNQPIPSVEIISKLDAKELHKLNLSNYSRDNGNNSTIDLFKTNGNANNFLSSSNLNFVPHNKQSNAYDTDTLTVTPELLNKLITMKTKKNTVEEELSKSQPIVNPILNQLKANEIYLINQNNNVLNTTDLFIPKGSNENGMDKNNFMHDNNNELNTTESFLTLFEDSRNDYDFNATHALLSNKSNKKIGSKGDFLNQNNYDFILTQPFLSEKSIKKATDNDNSLNKNDSDFNATLLFLPKNPNQESAYENDCFINNCGFNETPAFSPKKVNKKITPECAFLNKNELNVSQHKKSNQGVESDSLNHNDNELNANNSICALLEAQDKIGEFMGSKNSDSDFTLPFPLLFKKSNKRAAEGNDSLNQNICDDSEIPKKLYKTSAGENHSINQNPNNTNTAEIESLNQHDVDLNTTDSILDYFESQDKMDEFMVSKDSDYDFTIPSPLLFSKSNKTAAEENDSLNQIIHDVNDSLIQNNRDVNESQSMLPKNTNQNDDDLNSRDSILALLEAEDKIEDFMSSKDSDYDFTIPSPLLFSKPNKEATEENDSLTQINCDANETQPFSLKNSNGTDAVVDDCLNQNDDDFIAQNGDSFLVLLTNENTTDECVHRENSDHNCNQAQLLLSNKSNKTAADLNDSMNQNNLHVNEIESVLPKETSNIAAVESAAVNQNDSNVDASGKNGNDLNKTSTESNNLTVKSLINPLRKSFKLFCTSDEESSSDELLIKLLNKAKRSILEQIEIKEDDLQIIGDASQSNGNESQNNGDNLQNTEAATRNVCNRTVNFQDCIPTLDFMKNPDINSVKFIKNNDIKKKLINFVDVFKSYDLKNETIELKKKKQTNNLCKPNRNLRSTKTNTTDSNEIQRRNVSQPKKSTLNPDNEELSDLGECSGIGNTKNDANKVFGNKENFNKVAKKKRMRNRSRN